MPNSSGSTVDFVAHEGSSTFADAGVAARLPLRLAAQGLRADERGLLTSILGILRDRTERPWVASEPESADLLIRTRQAQSEGPDTGLTALLLREGEQCDDPDALLLHAPLRVMQVMELLNAACDRLAQRSMGCDRLPEVAPLRIEDDENSLAAALARLLARKCDQTLRVRVLGHGTLYLCTRERLYHCDFPVDQLQTVLEAHRFVLTALGPDSPEFAAMRPSCRPIQSLLWSIGLATPWETAGAVSQRYELLSWPDFARLPARPEHIRLCASLSVRPMHAGELARTARISLGDASHFLHACWLCGAVAATDAARDAPVHSRADQNAAHRPSGAIGGLFERLWRRLGG